MNNSLDYLGHLKRESARFLEALREVPSDAPVPTCPDWDAEDLLWHLAEVQWFWGTVVRENVTDGSVANDLNAERPSSRSEVAAFYERASSDLVRILSATPPETRAWTWSEEQTVRFIRRRQAHEAFIHRIDAELVAGTRTPMDTALSADGVDEVLRIMYGGAPPWGNFAPRPEETIRLRTSDTDDSWLVTMGQFTGTDPESSTSYDEPDIRVSDKDAGTEAAATIVGQAADLNSWLWHRPTSGDIVRTGDAAVLNVFETTIGPGID